MTNDIKVLSEKFNVTFEEEAKQNRIIVKEYKSDDVEIIKDADIKSPSNALPYYLELDEKDDYNTTRKNLYDLTQASNEAIGKLAEIASLTKSPRAFEVLAKLIQVGGETNDRLYLLQDKARKVKGYSSADERSRQSVNVEKAVFVGSPADLLKR